VGYLHGGENGENHVILYELFCLLSNSNFDFVTASCTTSMSDEIS